jgi:hypothetical protein
MRNLKRESDSAMMVGRMILFSIAMAFGALLVIAAAIGSAR